MSELYDWSKDVEKIGDQGGTHWLGEVEVSKLPCRFHLYPVEDPKETKLRGRPIMKDKLHVTVLLPGGDSVTRPVRESDRYEFPAAWAAWEKDQSAPNEGTPLEEWPRATPAAIANLHANNVFTVEQLMELSDAHCEAIGSIAYMLRDKARDYIAKSEGQNLELEAVKEENAALAKQLADMQAAIDEMKKAAAPKRRGRPRKVKPNATDDNSGRGGSTGVAEA